MQDVECLEAKFKFVNRVWTPARAKASLAGLHWHDLRHTFASRLVMAGVDLRTVQELIGHKTITMTLRYAHLSPTYQRDAVQRLLRERLAVEEKKAAAERQQIRELKIIQNQLEAIRSR